MITAPCQRRRSDGVLDDGPLDYRGKALLDITRMSIGPGE
jgi:hypothetical protein